MWKYRFSLLYLVLIKFFALASAAKFGINFYDEANFLSPEKQHQPKHMQAIPELANQHFRILRTITDFNEGDPGQRVCSCYTVDSSVMNRCQCAFQKGVNPTNHLKLILTIENPNKWLATKAKAISYLYQFILPLQKGVFFPKKLDLQPYFWGIKPNSMKAAGCVINPKTNHILAIVVGLEVGTHLNPISYNFSHKAKQVTQLNNYINNLITALNDFGLKKTIYVTTSIAPSNCDEASRKCGNILELLPLRNGHYYLNKNKEIINGQVVNFANAALKTIEAQQYSGKPLGVLMSLYHYWQYFPGKNLANFNVTKWETEIEARHELLQEAIHQQPGLTNLPVSVGEIGWPAAGDPRHDGAPNEPSLETHYRLLQAVYNWAKNDTDKIAPVILIWRMFEIDHDAALNMSGFNTNPEFSYGIFDDELENLYDQSILISRNAQLFPDFKNFKIGENLIKMPGDIITKKIKKKKLLCLLYCLRIRRILEEI